jgi:AcrR family transcriptional regulator
LVYNKGKYPALKTVSKESQPMPTIASTKDKILDTAVRLFYKRGIRATGVDLIINEAGVHKSTFFKHYPSKGDVIIAYLKIRDQDRLVAIFDALSEWFNQQDFRGCAFINTVAECADETSIEFRLSVEHKQTLEIYVTKLAKAANIRQSKQLVEQIMLLMEGAIIRAQMERNAKPALVGKNIVKTLLASGGLTS